MTLQTVLFTVTIVILSTSQFGTAVPPKEISLGAGAIAPVTGEDVCNLPKKEGDDSCMGYIPVFYYNSKENKCEKFHYKGCEGNENRFNKLVDCQERCVK